MAALTMVAAGAVMKAAALPARHRPPMLALDPKGSTATAERGLRVYRRALMSRQAVTYRERSQWVYRNLSARRAIAEDVSALPSLAVRPRLGLLGYPGVHVKRYLAADVALVDVSTPKARESRHRQAVVVAGLPLRARDSLNEGLKPVDLRLSEEHGRLEPRNPLASVSIAGALGREVLTLPSIGVSVQEVGSLPVRGRLVAGKVIFPNALAVPDTDLLVAPAPTGAEISSIFRSPRSPETLRYRFALPAGATIGIRPTPTRQPHGRSTAGWQRDVVIIRNHRTLATMLPPVAVDAQGRPVPVSYSVAGTTLVLRVSHRDHGYAYPILIDPYISEDQRYWESNVGSDPYGTPDFTGWIHGSAAGTNIIGLKGQYTEPSAYGSISFPNGLLLGTSAGGSSYSGGSWGNWIFQAPGTGTEAAHIFKFDAGYTSNIPGFSSASGANQTCLQAGIYTATGAPEQGLIYRGSAVTDPYSNGIYNQCTVNYSPGFYTVFCLSTCDDRGGDPTKGSPNNVAGFALTVPAATTLDAAGWAFMGSSLVFESDNYPPHLDTSGANQTWMSSDTTDSISATDYGVGTYTMTATAPAWTGASTGPPTSCATGIQSEGTDTPGAPITGDRNHRCPIGTPMTLSFSTSAFAEGNHSVTLTAADVVGNTATAAVPVNIDKTAPTVIASGQLYDDSQQGSTPTTITGDGYALQINADDSSSAGGDGQVSGIKDITVQVDSNTPTVYGGHCLSGDCSTGAGTFAAKAAATYVFQNSLYAAGTHTVTVRTDDNAGHTGSQTLVVVTAPGNPGSRSDTLGLEQFYPYRELPTGAGSAARVNLATGNFVWNAMPISDPGRGLTSFFALTYNSQHRLTEFGLPGIDGVPGFGYDQAGEGWSLSLSGLTRINEPIDVTVPGQGVSLVDGDGTSHLFAKDPNSNSYLTPPGVHLHVRQFSSTDSSRAWAITRPDGVTYFFNSQGYQTLIEDRNGNTLTYQYQYFLPGTDTPCPNAIDLGCSPRLSSVTDAGGRNLTLSYYPYSLPLVGGTTNPASGKLESVTDHDGDQVTLAYDQNGSADPGSGELTTLTEATGTPAARSFSFAYDSVTLPSRVGDINIPAALTTQAELTSITDPNGNAATPPAGDRPTEITYRSGAAIGGAETCPAQQGPLTIVPRCVTGVSDRNGQPYRFAYGSSVTASCQGSSADVTDPRGFDWCYQIDGQDRPTQEVSPMHPHTGLASDQAGTATDFTWDGDNNLTQIIEAAGTSGQATSKMSYDPLGRLTSETDADTHKTSLSYTYSAGAPSLTAPGDTSGFVGDLTSLQTPNNAAAANSGYSFTVQTATGDVTQEKDPEGDITSVSYNVDGTVHGETDAQGHVTTFPSYDPSGLPTERDLPNLASGAGVHWHYSYDPNGNLLDVADPRAGSTPGDGQSLRGQAYNTAFVYDALNRMTLSSTPKASVGGEFVTKTFAYDADDNPVAATEQDAGGTAAGPCVASACMWTATYSPMDKVLSDTTPPVPHDSGDATSASGAEATSYGYDAMNELTSVTRPNGQGRTDGAYTTRFTLDEAGNPVIETQQSTTAPSLVSSWCYDRRGNVVGVADPNTNAVFTSLPFDENACNGSIASTEYAYDAADNRTATFTTPTPAAQRQLGAPLTQYETTYAYDADNNVTAVTDPRGQLQSGNFTTSYAYDQRDLLIAVTDPLGDKAIYSRRGDSGPDLGNGQPGDGRIIAITKPDANGNPANGFTTTFTYDAQNWLRSYSLPSASNEYPLGQGTVTYTRDSVGDPTSIVDGRGNAITNNFFDTGELASTNRPSWWIYDPGATASGAGGGDPNPGGPNQEPAATPGGGFAIRERSPDELAQLAQERAGRNRPSDALATQNGQVSPQADPPLLPYAGSTSFSYDAEMRLTAVRANNGATTTDLTRDALGRLSDLVLPFDGSTTIDRQYRYDPDGNLTSYSPSTADQSQFPQTSYVYDQFDRRVEQDAPAASGGTAKTLYGLDANGNLTSVKTPVQTAMVNGAAATMTYDGLDELSSMTDPVGDQTTYCYDPAGNETRMIRPNGTGPSCGTTNPAAAYTTTMTYNAANEVTRRVDGSASPALTTTLYGYDPDGNETSSAQVASDGSSACPSDGCRVTNVTYDGRDLPWSSTSGTGADARTTVTEYDQNGNLRRTVFNAGVDPNTKRPYVTDGGDSDQGDTEVNSVDDGTGQMTHSGTGTGVAQPSSDAEIDATVRAYDPSGFETEIYLPWGCRLSQNAGHAQCLAAQVSAPDNHQYREDFIPDAYGRVHSVRSPNEWATNAAAETDTYTYYPDGWLNTASEALFTGAALSQERASTYAYDRLGNETTWAANVAGSGNGFKVTRTYNRAGLLASRQAVSTGTTPDGEQRGPYTYGYDADGNVTSFQDQTPTSSSVPAAIVTNTTLTYDAADRLVVVNAERAKIGDPTGDTRYVYDKDGNVVTRQTDGTESTSTGGYPADSYSGGKMTRFTFDPLDREQTMQVTGTPAAAGREYDTSYTQAGLPDTRTITPAGGAKITEGYSYNDDGMLAQMTRSGASVAKNQSYTYDVNGNRTADERGTHLFNAQNQEVQWTRAPGQPNANAAGAVCSATSPSSCTGIAYAVNGAGAITSETDNAPVQGQPTTTTTTFTLKGSQLESSATTARATLNGTTATCTTGVTYAYNGLGDMLSSTPSTPAGSCPRLYRAVAPTTYQYNDFDQLAQATGPDPLATTTPPPTVTDKYTYDGFDRRDTKAETRGSNTTTYEQGYIGNSDALSRETAPNPAGLGTGTDVRTFDYTSGLRRTGYSSQPVGSSSATVRTYGLDANGSTESLINSDGSTSSYYYDPYGNLQSTDPTKPAEQTLTAAAQDNPFRFEGFYEDSGVQTYNMLARQYRPDAAIFLEQDRYEAGAGQINLVSDPLTNDLYVFAGGNPTTNLEWDGHYSDFGCSQCREGPGYQYRPPTATHSGSYTDTQTGQSAGYVPNNTYVARDNHLPIGIREQAAASIEPAQVPPPASLMNSVETDLALAGAVVHQYCNPVRGRICDASQSGVASVTQGVGHALLYGTSLKAVALPHVYSENGSSPVLDLTFVTGPLEGLAVHGLEGVLAGLVGSSGSDLVPEGAAELRGIVQAAEEPLADAPAFARSQYGRASASDRAAAFEKTPTCPYCGEAPSTQVDHITSLKQDWLEGGWQDPFDVRTGRINDPENLTGACGPCNASKGARPIGQGPGEWWPPGWGDTPWPFGGGGG